MRWILIHLRQQVEKWTSRESQRLLVVKMLGLRVGWARGSRAGRSSEKREEPWPLGSFQVGTEEKSTDQDISLLDRKTASLWELEEALPLLGSLETGLGATEALQTLMAMWVKPASCVLSTGLHCWQLGGVGHPSWEKVPKTGLQLTSCKTWKL